MLTAIPNISTELPIPTITSKSLEHLEGWIFDPEFSLRHHTNKFFTLIGYSNIDTSKNIILFDQNEIGYLLVARNSISSDPLDDLIFCSVKFEPGNFPFYQLSPTVQKTFSNLTAVHGGPNSL